MSSTPLLCTPTSSAPPVNPRFLLAQSRGLVGYDKSSQGTWSGSYTFVQMADTQFGLMSAMKKAQRLRMVNALTCGLTKPLIPIPLDLSPSLTVAAAYAEEIAFAKRCVACINRLAPRPRFVVVCGDLVNAFPSSAEEQERQVRDYMDVMSSVDPDIPLVCLCGNHDVGDKPTRATIDLYRGRFGDDYLSFWLGGVKYVCVNTQLYKDASLCGDVADEQELWLEKELEKDNVEGAKHVVVFSHIMPFVENKEEADGYFNLSREVRKPLLDKMLEAGVGKWFCGHFHRNAGGWCDNGKEGAERKEMEVVITAAVGCNITTDERGDLLGLSGMAGVVMDADISGVRVVNVGEKGIEHKFHTLNQLEAAAGSQM